MKKDKIEKKIEQLTSEQALKNSPKERLEEYLAASKTFEDLVARGLAKRRGFNLLSIDKKSDFQLNNNTSLTDHLMKL
jgi:hypothetical protein